MYLACRQDQLTTSLPMATVWCCASRPARETLGTSKSFAHRGSRFAIVCAKPARLGNPQNLEDRH